MASEVAIVAETLGTFEQLVAEVGPDEWAAQTPCPE